MASCSLCSAAAQTLLVPSQYPTIEGAITAAKNGDTIMVSAGTYTPASGRIIIDKSITLTADPALAIRPIIKTRCAEWSACAVQIAADNVNLSGFEIDNSAAGTLTGYIVGDYNTQKNSWTVNNCDIHNGRNALRIVGDNVVIQNNNLHETNSHLINCENGRCTGLKVLHNWLHSEHYTQGGKPAGIKLACYAVAGADIEISYNYCWASRTLVDMWAANNSSPAYKVTISHNTVDFWMGPVPTSVIDKGDEGQYWSVAWWADTGSWNANNFIVKDNLFTRQKYYVVCDTTTTTVAGQFQINNNLFWQYYLDKNLPSCPYSWPTSPHGAIGSDNLSKVFNLTNNVLDKDPKYASTGTNPESYYALQSGSPAIGKASDKTNIGAWQGGKVPTIKNVAPNHASTGKTINITGNNFTGATQVLFNTTSAAITGKVMDQNVNVIVPAGMSGQTVNVTVVTPSGSYTLYNAFTFEAN